MFQEFLEGGICGGIDLWEGLGNILFVDLDMVVVAVALYGDCGPRDIGSSSSLRVGQVCSGCPTWGIFDEDGMIVSVLLSLIDRVENRMDVVVAELEIVVVGQPGAKWQQ